MKIVLWVISIVLVLGVLSGGFYWYEWRPSQVKKECSDYAYSVVNKADILVGFSSWKSLWDYQYSGCLSGRGL